MSQRSAPTLDDVARAAGVSTATVSRCLNSPELVIEKTRDRVLSAVAKLGYSPNFGARVMAAKRTNTIGAVIPTMENAIFARGIQAFQQELQSLGYTLLVSSSSYQAKAEEEQIRSLVSRGADGLLLIGHDRSARIVEFLAQQSVPTLVAWSYDPTAILPSVGFDNRTAMKAIAGHVLGLGHRNIGMITGLTAENDRARMRLHGVHDAMVEAGLSASDLRVVETPYGIEQGQAAFARLIEAKVPPTAVLCGNDVLAVGAILEARQRKMRVPEDVSITGFDNIELARVVEPGLTTVHVPHRQMGTLAAKTLVEMVTGGAPGTLTELPTRLLLRASLAPIGQNVT